MTQPVAREDVGQANDVLTLEVRWARELMTASPETIHPSTTVKQAARILSDRGFSAMPVADETNLIKGVLSQADIVRFERERGLYTEEEANPSGKKSPTDNYVARGGEELSTGFHVEQDDSPPISEIMTPFLLSVGPQDSPRKVIETLIRHKIHRVFVVEGENLLGVISATDVLRKMI